MLYSGLQTSINQLQCDPEALWDSKTLGLARAANTLLGYHHGKASRHVVKRALAINDLELVLLKR